MQRRETYGILERFAKCLSIAGFVLALAAMVISCAGGSGSSGFDLAENEAIDRALDEQRCVESEGLTICPAGETATPVPEPTLARTATPVPTATTDPIDLPTQAPQTPSSQGTETVTPKPTPTPTRTASPTPPVEAGMSIDTSFDGSEGFQCIPSEVPGTCLLPFVFMPRGFSVDSHYQVAVRHAADEGWELLEAVQISFDALTSIFQADIPIEAETQATTVTLQTAVLVFVDQLPVLPPMEIVERLSDSGADFAFVNPEEELELTIE